MVMCVEEYAKEKAGGLFKLLPPEASGCKPGAKYFVLTDPEVASLHLRMYNFFEDILET